jgi:hypothetical protein
MASPLNLDQYSAYLRQYATTNRQYYDTLETRQRAEEQEIIERTDSFCPLRQIQDVTSTADQITRALREGFDDANILRSIMCLNNSIAVFPGNTEKDIGRSFKIRHYLRDLQQIGGESAEGYAMTTDVRSLGDSDEDLDILYKNQQSSSAALLSSSDPDKPFVAKSPRRTTEEGNEGLLHEYFVGAFGTNTLRSLIPNFAFILGTFQCSPPYIDRQYYATDDPDDDKRKALTYCQNNNSQNQVNYILLENIANSKTFRDFIFDGASFSEYLNVFTQVIFALHVAQRVGFTHYDLHSENVLVLPLPEAITIYYDDVGYLTTKYLAFIIDYGRSHIIYNGNHYGFNGVPIGTFPNLAYPMFDIFKLLCFTLMDAAFGDRNYTRYTQMTDQELETGGFLTNQKVFQQAKPMLKYFYPELNLNQTANYLIVTRRHFYTLPYSPQFDISVLDFYQNAMVPLYSQLLITFISEQPPVDQDQIYGCARKGFCLTLKEAINNYSEPDNDYIQDPYVFYEMLYEKDRGNARLIDLNEIIAEGSQHYEEYIEQLGEDANSKIDRYNSIAQTVAAASIRGAAPEVVKFSPNSLELYRKYVAKIVRLFDLMNELLEIETITDLLNQIYPQQAIQPDYLTNINELKTIIPQLNANLASIKEDAQYIQRINQNNILQINPNASWLFEKLPTIPSAVTPIV